jgi:glutamate synthase domain-containing protein 1
MSNIPGYPSKQGLYDPRNERDACGMGFVVNIKGQKSHELVHQALEVLVNLEHRGACGCEPNTGDGAGILMQIPHKFFAAVCDFELPEAGAYGVGMLFVPRDKKARAICEETLARIIEEEGQTLLGWRDVPVNNSQLGDTALKGEPIIRQVFIGRSQSVGSDPLDFERVLYVIRKRAANTIRYSGQVPSYYTASFSARTIVYKGMFISTQVEPYYPDLLDKRLESALALVHSRFSTNTFPSWQRAHPYRYIIHNGEINTVRGNGNWMRGYARIRTLWRQAP